MKLKSLAHALTVTGLLAPVTVFATNGMNMEGYGPVATGMGGASYAYDNGSAAMMNNPATLGLMAEGRRADLAYGFLGPDVTSSAGGLSSNSGGDAYSMPAFGWLRKSGKLTYGFGIYGQGGMGTEYDGSSFMSAGSGLPTRSEIGVGRALLPLAYDVSPDLSVGGTLDFVWAQMDLQMAMTQSQMMGMQAAGLGSISGSFTGGLGGLNGSDVGYFNFSDDNDFTGKAKGSGFAGKIGIVLKASPQLSIGATYHTKTNLSDMETSGAEVRIVRPGVGTLQSVSGKLTIKDFQWPETFGLGLAYQATPSLMLAADYKRINWADVMQDFKMTFQADNGADLNTTLNQFWEDQNVLMLGLAYQYNDALTLRAGVNLANNPVPDFYMHPLFPAIEEDHMTLGLGYRFDKTSSVDFSFSYGQQVTATNSSGVTVDHSQTNWQFIYSHRY